MRTVQFNHEIIPVATAQEMVDVYQSSCQKIREGYKLLEDAQADLERVFGDYTGYGDFRTVDEHCKTWYYREGRTISLEVSEAIILKIKRSVWAKIIGRLGIRKLMSLKRIEKLDNDIKEGTVPEITIETIFDLLQHFEQSADEIAKELLKEVFDLLRPRGTQYKTPRRDILGKKAVLGYTVSRGWGDGKYFSVRYERVDRLNALDRLFYLMDGRQAPESYSGELADAINTVDSSGYGESTYFKFRACMNGNLWIEFKRSDLVAKINRIAGGMNFPEQV